MSETGSSGKVTISDAFFVNFIYGLSTFARKPTDKDYATDAALFEIGCYTGFRVYNLLYYNHPELHKELSTKLDCSFVILFSEALGKPAQGSGGILELYSQRREKYFDLYCAEADLGKYVFYLTELVLLSKGNRAPRSYNFDNEPLSSLSAVESTSLQLQIGTWLANMQPAMIESLDRLLKKVKAL